MDVQTLKSYGLRKGNTKQQEQEQEQEEEQQHGQQQR